MNEEKLVTQCKKAKASAQTEVYKIFAPRLRGVCRRYILDFDQAEDVLQEGFFKIFTQIEKFEWQGDGSFFFWMKRVIINLALNQLKKNKNRFLDESLPEGYEDSETTNENNFFDDDYSKFSKDDVIQALNAVPEHFKIVLNMAILDGMKHKEIGELLGIAEETSRSRLTRAKLMLRTALIGKSVLIAAVV